MTAASTFFNQQANLVDSLLYKLRCYRDPQRIRNDVLELLKNIPSLQPRSGQLSNSPGGATLLYLAGTVPIYYSGSQYNIPVNIWVIEAYPFSPPIVYVTPTPDMIIKPRHRHVDSNGVVYLPYLSNWNPNNCNLLGLASTLSKIFSTDPPVRSTGATPPPQPAQATPPSPYAQPPSSQYPPSQPQQYPYQTTPSHQQPQPASYSNAQYPPPNQQYPPPTSTSQYPPATYGQPAPPVLSPQQPYEDPAVVAKRNAVRSATERIQAKLHEFNVACTKDVDEQILISQREEDRARSLDQERMHLEQQKAAMSTDVDNLTRYLDEITSWLSANDTQKEWDIDTVTEPKDILTKQLLLLVAEDATIEDTLYYLEKKLNSGALELDVFLKTVRSLSADQFAKRATIKKIHERQRALRT